MDRLTWFAAFTAGLLSFLSPCVLPLLPAFVTHLTGSVLKGGKIAGNKGFILLHSLFFIIGFSLVFVALGASSTLVGQWLGGHRMIVRQASGLLIIVFGLQMAGLLHIRLPVWSIVEPNFGLPTSIVASLLTGMAFGAGWTPCVGLAFASILLLAGTAETMREGIGFLAMYSIGMGIPFLIVSLLISYSLSFLRFMNRYIPLFARVNGYLMIGMGLVLFTGIWGNVSAWLDRFI